MDEQSKAARRRKLYESRREREFYAYYESLISLYKKEPRFCNLGDPDSVASHEATSSPDKALTAFVQLAALRLRARRSMLFFFDQSYAYVLAEATRSLSLQDDSRHTAGDSLWLGTSKIPRGFSICEVTADLPVNNGTNAHDAESKAIAHVINNLAEDTRFCDRPFVQDGPRARFYAGVPITTSKGINIGALCVLDDEPRGGLDSAELLFLTDMSTTVMAHLEMVSLMVRAKTENQRGHDMVTALGAFVEGKSDPQDWWRHGRRGPPRRPVQSRNPSSLENDTSSAAEPVPAPPSTPKFRTAEESQEDSFTAQVATTTNRAAGLIREAVRADGVVFLDASISSFGGLVENSHASTDEASHLSDAPESNRTTSYRERLSRNCPILGFKYAPSRQFAKDASIQHPKVAERFLKSLLRRYPEGKIWRFNQDGDASDEEIMSEGQLSGFNSMESESDGTPKLSARHLQKRKFSRMKDGRVIQDIFPGVRSVLLLGIWDNHRDRWFGACLVLSYSPIRIFSSQSDMNYLAAFCDVWLSDIARLEAQMVSRSKNDFISSISHELRSPLHGILGSAECLEERLSTALSHELLQSIISCGNTLLDVINDLLEYSRVNKGAQRRNTRAAQLAQPVGPVSSQPGVVLDASSVESAVMVATLTEEAVNAACLGFDRNRVPPVDAQAAHNGHVVVTLDIEKAFSTGWSLGIAAGAWKRVIMNLVSNALKYTPSGYVRVNLHRGSSTRDVGKDKISLIHLSVEDSGVGMSASFQRESLFRAFHQENSIVAGTGLGLNLVAHIVRSRGGTINVRSNKGIGTSVKVSLPLRAGPASSMGHFVLEKPAPFAALAVLWGLQDSNDQGTTQYPAEIMLRKSIVDCCSQLGVRLCNIDDPDVNQADFYIIHEPELEKHGHIGDKDNKHLPPGLSTQDRPVILISSTRIAPPRPGSSPPLPPNTQRLFLPIGPIKLATAISTSLKTPLPDKDRIEVADALLAVASGTGTDVALGLLQPSTNLLEDHVGPSMKSEPEAEPRTLPELSKPTVSMQPRKVSLLLVDDNNVNLRLLTVFAQRKGYPYRTAEHGQEAVAKYKAAALEQGDKPDVILMDINMPIMDGFQATKMIRQFEQQSGTDRATVIALTGLGNVAAQQESFASGMDLFLTKPVKLKELGNLLAKM